MPQKLLLELDQVSIWIGTLTRHALPRILRPKNAEVKPTSASGGSFRAGDDPGVAGIPNPVRLLISNSNLSAAGDNQSEIVSHLACAELKSGRKNRIEH